MKDERAPDLNTPGFEPETQWSEVECSTPRPSAPRWSGRVREQLAQEGPLRDLSCGDQNSRAEWNTEDTSLREINFVGQTTHILMWPLREIHRG